MTRQLSGMEVHHLLSLVLTVGARPIGVNMKSRYQLHRKQLHFDPMSHAKGQDCSVPR